MVHLPATLSSVSCSTPSNGTATGKSSAAVADYQFLREALVEAAKKHELIIRTYAG